jgi:hypothetical protein
MSTYRMELDVHAATAGSVFVASLQLESTMKFKLFSAATAMLFVANAVTGCATRTGYADLYGMPAPASAAVRTIVISPNTRYVNVEGGEVVNFIVGDKAFAWDFFVAPTVSAFDLNEAAPSGMLDHVVRAYISPDPKYIGGDGPAS